MHLYVRMYVHKTTQYSTYFVQIDDHITVLQQDPDRAEGRPSVLQSVLLRRLPTLLQSEGGTEYGNTDLASVHYLQMVSVLSQCVGEDLCLSRLGI